MAPVITLKGIDEAISNLGYRNQKGTKSRLVQAIRAHYERDDFILSLISIDSDSLIRMLWANALDPITIRNRRRNLSSIKSSVNADFKKIYEEGKNPEGITISPSNTFVMSEEAKDSALEALRDGADMDGAGGLGQLAGALNSLKEVLSSSENLDELSKDQGPAALHELQDLIRGLSEKIGIAGIGALGAGEKESGRFGAVVSAGGEIPGPSGEGGTGEKTGSNSKSDILEKAGMTPEMGLKERPDVTGSEEGTGSFSGEVEEIAEAPDIETEEIDALEEGIWEEAPGGEEAVESEEEDVIEIPQDELPEDIEETEEGESAEYDMDPVEEEPEEVDARETAFEDGDLEFADPEPADEILEAIDEEGEAISEEEVEEVDDAGALEALDEPELGGGEEFEEADPEEGGSEIELSCDLEEIEEAPDTETDEVETLEEEEPEEDFEEVEAFDAEALEEQPVDASDFGEDVGVIGPIEGQESEQGLGGPEADDGGREGGIEGKGGVGGNVDSLELTDDFREEDLLAEAEESGRLLMDFGEESLNGEAGPNQNTDSSRVLAEQFNRSLAAMDRFFNQYVLIPGGKYPVGKKRPVKVERAKQIIELSSFYMGKYPVTNALFEVFAEKTGYKTTAERVGYGTVYDGRVQRKVDEETGLETYTWSSSLTNKIVKGACWYQPLGPGSTLHKKRNHPVVQISLDDALAFAAWTGKGLPTEDEWEAASRTATGYSLPWGKKWERDACNSENTSIGDTTPVDRFMEWENELGIADTLGNVWEWTSTPFENGAESNGRSYIAKGGSWVTGKPLNLATRFRVDPASYSNILGFRCVAY